MRHPAAEDVYKFYNQFLDVFVLQGNSILTDDVQILSPTTIQNCFVNYVDNYKIGGESFGEKVKEQFKNADIPTRLVFAHAEWLWAFAVTDITTSTKREITRRTTGLDDSKLKDVYPRGFGSAGTYHKNNKYEEIKFILLLIRFLERKIDDKEITAAAELNEWVEKICLFQKYGQEDASYQLPETFKNEIDGKTLATCNILLHVSKPNRYERIASDSHKRQIVDSFSGLLTEQELNDEDRNTDQKIELIRARLAGLTKPDFDFYESQYMQVWNFALTEEDFSEVQGLQYKKAVILYGPPGTSKTHSAKRLARVLITKSLLRKKENVTRFLTAHEDLTESKIHRLQLHPNYTYEDFVAGIQLKNHSTEPVKGKLFAICEAAEKDKAAALIDDVPHVLILDEINRIDLSRLFGEVFSALENRDEPIDVGVGNFQLTIPRNLYVIGTMNEIDFSLERIDFALRRRFLWFFYGFNKDTLAEIFSSKDRQLNTRLKPDEAERFFKNAAALNEEITKLPELGKQYQIGHTFFGEIVNIYKSFKELGGYKNLQKQLYRKHGPAQILWEISLAPMLEAFLGNMDIETREEKINELKKIYDK